MAHNVNLEPVDYMNSWIIQNLKFLDGPEYEISEIVKNVKLLIGPPCNHSISLKINPYQSRSTLL